jgi:hypothetical protein
MDRILDIGLDNLDYERHIQERIITYTIAKRGAREEFMGHLAFGFCYLQYQPILHSSPNGPFRKGASRLRLPTAVQPNLLSTSP